MSLATTSIAGLRVGAFALLALPSLAGCESDCSASGKHYAVGEKFLDSDGCNGCTCTTEGVLCTSAECGPVVDAGLQTDDASARIQCDEQTRRSSEALQSALSSVDNSCTSDADCRLLYLGSDCYAGCGVVLSKQGKAAIEAAAEAQADTLCADFEARGCKRIIPPCDGPGSVACVDGTCRELPEGYLRLSSP